MLDTSLSGAGPKAKRMTGRDIVTRGLLLLYIMALIGLGLWAVARY